MAPTFTLLDLRIRLASLPLTGRGSDRRSCVDFIVMLDIIDTIDAGESSGARDPKLFPRSLAGLRIFALDSTGFPYNFVKLELSGTVPS